MRVSLWHCLLAATTAVRPINRHRLCAREAFANNLISVARFDAPGQKLIALYPNLTSAALAQNYTNLVPIGVTNNKFNWQPEFRAYHLRPLATHDSDRSEVLVLIKTESIREVRNRN